MKVDGDEKEEFPEVNQSVHDENRKIRDRVVGEGLDLSEEDELRINRIAGDVNNTHDGANQSQVVLQALQQHPQGSMVCWERFLHLRSLKVLLVENDNSTRHVVAALLRNCSYEVTEAANGSQAWKILEDPTNHIDLVLTEVVMPRLSGIGLLCKIVSHKTCKNIPVIMMSSHDSMGVVFKCLSKGAVDFLVKPIRKNELKNLWQHVWRRCHSSSGSGSESGTQTQKSVKSNSVEKSDNNTGSNDEDDNGSIGLNVGDGSDDGSGTQSSWTKRAVDVDSPRPMSPWDQIAECPDSTCAQVIHSNAESFVNKWMPMTATRKCQKQEEQLDNVAMGKDLEIGVPRNLDLQLEYSNDIPIQVMSPKQTNLTEGGSSKSCEKIDKGLLGLTNESPSSKLKCNAANLTCVITNTTDPQVDSKEFEAPNKISKISEIDKAINDTKELPSLELSLKRLRGVKDNGTTVQDDRNVLRRSDISAFSRYNKASNANKASSGNIGSDCAPDNSLEVVKKASVHNVQSHSNCNPPNQCSNEGSSNIDMGSTNNNSFTKPVILRNKSVTKSASKCLHPSSAYQTIKNDHLCAPQQVILDKANDMITTAALAQPKDPHPELQIQHLHYYYDHLHHPVHNMQHHKLPADHDDFSLKKMAAAAPHCGSSNVLGGSVEGISVNYSLNGSASGSNHGSNGQNGSSTAVNAGGTNMESDKGLAGRSGSGDASGSRSGNREHQNKFFHREAALTKFRQKRNERCFRNKVRYQSRKRVAEQRPRVRGQFVGQIVHENTSRTNR